MAEISRRNFLTGIVGLVSAGVAGCGADSIPPPGRCIEGPDPYPIATPDGMQECVVRQLYAQDHVELPSWVRPGMHLRFIHHNGTSDSMRVVAVDPVARSITLV